MVFWLRMLGAAVGGAAMRLAYRLVAFLLAFIGAGFVVAVVASLVARALVPIAEGRLDRRWAEALVPLSTLPERVLPHQANAKALEVEAAAAELGIDLATVGQSGRRHPDADAAARFDALSETLARYCNSMIQLEGALEQPAPEIIRFLDDTRPSLDQVIALLREGTPPRWESDVTMGSTMPLPKLSDQVQLQRLLATWAVLRWQRGDVVGASEVVEASWRLNQPTIERPEMVSVLTALVPLQQQLAIVRRLDPPPPEWASRLDGLDLETRYLHALQTEAWRAVHSPRTGELLDMGKPWVRFMVHPLSTPFQRWAMHDHAEALRRAVVELPSREFPGFERGQFAAELRNSTPRWNSLARRALPDVGSGWLQTVRASLGVELTVRLVQARELVVRSGTEALSPLAGEQPSHVKNLSWQYRIEPRVITIALDGEPYPLAHDGFVPLPLRATASLPRQSPARGRRVSSGP